MSQETCSDQMVVKEDGDSLGWEGQIQLIDLSNAMTNNEVWGGGMVEAEWKVVGKDLVHNGVWGGMKAVWIDPGKDMVGNKVWGEMQAE
mmetsp:Transcript_31828/g.67422  ORF Transcript_31828/g.67422 Transcript_31828/m.67422 type:complete len:89 (+) Transcript_31828:253-519(+)